MRTPSGATRVVAVIGDPVTHSLSPALHNAAFAALGLDWVYVAFPVTAGSGAAAVQAVRALGIAGLSVTMPHKAAVAAAVDRLTPAASRLAGVNTVFRDGHTLVGDSTDGPGFVEAVVQDQGWDPAGRTCVLLGAGGAARAVALALGEAGASQVIVVARRPEAAAACAALAGPAGRVGSVDEVAGADLVANATPVGMGPAGTGPAGMGVGRDPDGPGPAGPGLSNDLPFRLDPGRLGAGQLVVDMVYAPALTPLVAVARQRGAVAVNGVGMLVHQAAGQFRHWTGRDAPLDAMAKAAAAALGESAG